MKENEKFSYDGVAKMHGQALLSVSYKLILGLSII